MAEHGRALGARLAISFALLAYTLFVVGSGLDRLTVQAPGLERLVPGPFRAQAELAAARLAAARNQRNIFLAHARAAVARDPVDPGSDSLLGGALLLRGDALGAERAFRVAARFGWRDVGTQAYWYEAALEAGAMEPAVDRLDALLRAEPDLPTAQLLFERLEASAAGRAALERRLAQRPAWLDRYLQLPDKPAGAADRRVAVLLDMAAHGTRLGCDTVSGFVGAALVLASRREAAQVWLAHCPGAQASVGVDDPAFAQVGSEHASPFGWQEVPSGDVAVESLASGSPARLRLSNSASVSRLVLTQPAALEPGRYRLMAKTAPGRIAVSLGCNAPPPLPSRDAGDLGVSGQILEVPACPRQTLGVWVRPGPEPVDLGALAIERIG